jgi:acyl-CoA synthetase (AMP-forming)/AMP-acid ligase II
LDVLSQVTERIEKDAERTFLIDSLSERSFSYAEFDALARDLALTLRARGVGHGDPVAILLENSAEFAILYFACLYLGAVAVPINTQLHREEIDFILRIAGARLIAHSAKSLDLFDAVEMEKGGASLFLVAEGANSGGVNTESTGWSASDRSPVADPGWQPFQGVKPTDLFSITFTSGTTSAPKGVAHRIESLLGNASWIYETLGLGSGDRMLHVFNMAYMAGFLNTLLCPFMAGGSVVLSRAFDARTMLRFWEPAIAHSINTLWLAPTMLTALLRFDRNPAGAEFSREHVKTVCVGTAPLPSSTKREFEDRYGVTVLESYGLSELLLLTSDSKRHPVAAGSVGRPLAEVEIKIVDDGGNGLPSGEDGEVLVRTPQAMSGYIDSESRETIALDPAEWFPSGDIGHLSEAGDLFITGRKKDLIIRGGMNISPRRIEDILLEHPAVAEVSVVGVEHEFYGEEVVAAIRLLSGHRLDDVRSALELVCKSHLSAVSMPNRFVEVSEFPMSVTGKVQKAKLARALSSNS